MIVNGQGRKILGTLLITPPFTDKEGNVVIIVIPVNPLVTISPTRTMTASQTDMITTTLGPGLNFFIHHFIIKHLLVLYLCVVNVLYLNEIIFVLILIYLQFLHSIYRL